MWKCHVTVTIFMRMKLLIQKWLKCHVTELSRRIELGIQNDQVFNKHQRGNLLSLGIFQHFNAGIVKGKKKYIFTALLTQNTLAFLWKWLYNNENAAADQHKRSPEDLKAETSRWRLSGEPLVQVPSPPRSSQGAERAVAPREGSV